jgi:hypothetical protein
LTENNVPIMQQLLPLLAVDWIQIAIFLFIIFSSLAGQLFKTRQEQRQQPDRRPPRKPRPDQRAPEPAFGDRAGQPQAELAPPKPERPRSPLQEEIETFLRRAMGQEPEQAEVVAEVVRPVEPEERIPTLVTLRQDEEPKESVAEHVARHLQQGEIEEREAAMGRFIGQSDERMESHLESVFDHSLGRLRRQEPRGSTREISQGTDAAVWDGTIQRRQLITAGQIAEKLSSPDEIASALVLGEILRRPTERWL